MGYWYALGKRITLDMPVFGLLIMKQKGQGDGPVTIRAHRCLTSRGPGPKKLLGLQLGIDFYRYRTGGKRAHLESHVVDAGAIRRLQHD